jgi:hypothetical protein
MVRCLLGCLALCGILIVADGAVAYGAETHVFDATLSLTGGCGVSEIDPVRDPGPPCPEGHPPSPFSNPTSVTVDNYGDIFVASYGGEGVEGAEGRIDVFDAEGLFVTEIPDANGPRNLVVDKQGNLYVFDYSPASGGTIRRYTPNPYNPEAGELQYKGEPTVLAEKIGASIMGLAINRVNDHFFAHFVTSIYEYGSAVEGSKLLDSTIGEGTQSLYSYGVGLAVDAVHGLIFATDRTKAAENIVRVYELASPHKLVRTIDGSTTPEGNFLNDKISLAVDEGTGHLYVYDAGGAEVVYELTATGEYVSTIEFGFKRTFGAQIGIDNGEHSPNGALNADGRYLYIPSFPSGTGHSFAFGPVPKKCAPEIKSAGFAQVSAEDTELQATINPCGLPTEYTFEYTTQEAFEAEGFAGASVASEGSIPAGNVGVEVSASATGLVPDTEYRFRVRASNEEGPAQTEGSFTTYPLSEAPPPCSTDATRTGPSALLPDCRAYELVTPPDTNARTPIGLSKGGVYFPTREASPDGNRVSFATEGGVIPGMEGTGSLLGDPYLSSRTEDGWSTASAGPNGEEAVSPAPGSPSPDQGYSFWRSGVSHVRYPDGHSELVGRGSIADDPQAEGVLISENGGHIVFWSTNHLSNEAIKLEPIAPPDGTEAIYDRTADEVTHVVSLLPGNVTPAAGQNAEYQGASLDGKGVAFEIGKKLYLRFNNEETYEIGENVTFAGVAEGGARIFYLKGGDLFSFDAKAEETIRFNESGDVTPVNVGAEGTAAYFISPSVLTGEEENPNGAKPQAGKENLYLSREGSISFVATVTERDVEGELGEHETFDGLGLWVAAAGLSGGNAGRFGIDPSRTTPDGSAMLFESRADLAGYDPEGHAEIYRYDSTGEELECLSCNPTQAPAASDASLQSVLQEKGGPEPFNSFVLVENLRADGNRAFFQSSEQLVLGDTDGLQDVYEWEAQGVGSCIHPEGCVYLISSGHSARSAYLYGVSDSGNDVFFRTSDLLLPVDQDETPSIYDARIGGGFPEPQCEGSALCSEPQAPSPPVLPAPTSPALPASGNLPPSKHCPKGKHKVTKNGKTNCVKNKKKHHKHHRASSKRKGAAK